jgi:benzodiazapine receptor
MNKDIVRQWTNVVAYVATLVVNVLANALPLNDLPTGVISDRFEVFFVPAGYAFSIWGLIYLGLGAFTVYQALPSQRENPVLRKIGYWFAISSAANIAWLFLWHYEQFPLTLLAMLSILISLIVIYQRAAIGRTPTSSIERWLVRVPFSVYMGWISVATIANVTDVLDYVSWSGWGIEPQIWAVIMLAIGTALALAMSLLRGDTAYILVFTWAFAAIAIKQAGTPLVANSAWAAAAAAAILAILGPFLTRGRARTS